MAEFVFPAIFTLNIVENRCNANAICAFVVVSSPRSLFSRKIKAQLENPMLWVHKFRRFAVLVPNWSDRTQLKTDHFLPFFSQYFSMSENGPCLAISGEILVSHSKHFRHFTPIMAFL